MKTKHTEDNLVKSYKKPKELDNWEKEFDKKFTAEKYPFIGKYQGKEVKEFIKQTLIQQRTELLEEIMKLEIGEFEGWDLAKKFNCCPGDDMADAYNQALKDVIKSLKQNEK